MWHLPPNARLLDLDSMESPSRHGDRLFLIALAGLCAVGLLMVYSASFYKGFETFRDPFHYLKDHAVRLGMGLALFWAAYRFDYHHLRRVSRWILVLCLLLLIAVLVVSPRPHRWLNLFGVTVQPSELVRMGLVIYLADWCSRHANRLREQWGTYLFALGVIAAPVGLVVLEPSFSAAAMIAIAGGFVLFFAGARLKHLALTVLPALPMGLIVALMEPYRMRRIFSFFNPTADPQGMGYQSNQSLIAVGSGKLFGVGMGMSGQKNDFLPEAHCDFIFSILCEEKGFAGAMVVLALFALFAWRGFKIALKAPDPFGFLLAGGLTWSIVLFILMNISVSLGLVPVTGLPLPFVSYGGSALIANLGACGIIMNISRHAQSPEAV
ncbi:MAG: putative lipid II flippase FtsW [Candidatus Zixiibacteriota bacterium]|nr:MAG: putative lipid II flippase FtsW [candidate division Zixibacteria bacterium]